jgi:hypothetical protein
LWPRAAGRLNYDLNALALLMRDWASDTLLAATIWLPFSSRKI